MPVYDAGVRAQLRRLIDLQLADNCKARSVEPDGTNPYLRDGGEPVRAQESFREYLASLALAGTPS